MTRPPQLLAAASTATAVVVAGAWYRWRASRRRKKLDVCWLSSRHPDASLLDRLASELEESCIFVVMTGALSDVPASTELLICGDAELYTEDAVSFLSASRIRAILIPYAGVHPSIRECCSKVEGMILANCHHNAPMTAEIAIALVLAATKRILRADRELREGNWRGRGLAISGAPRPVPFIPQTILDGKTVLVVGLGAVGQRVARSLDALGCRVIATSRTATDERGKPKELSFSRNQGTSTTTVTVYPASLLHDLLAQAFVVVLCLPLSVDTKGLIGRRELEIMRPDSVLVNISRGPIVDEAELADALDQKKIACYASDVWWHYPDDWAAAEHCPPFRDRDGAPIHFPKESVVFSPHRGGAIGLVESDIRRIDAISAALRQTALLGIPKGLITPPIGIVDVAAGY